MNRVASALAFLVLLAAGIAGGVGLSQRLEPPPFHPSAADTAAALQAAFNRAAETAMRSVVHISTKVQFASRENVGSGIIVSDQGHIVTNEHVIRLVKEIVVRFVDGAEYEATLVGRDPESDLAVVKIDPEGRPLTPIAFADSEAVRVGDVVFAIGSPFGYNHTVTGGIVSAKHRRTELNQPYEDFIQTDAAINPGNSGGALVNLNGELVGLNTAIVSQTRASEGIGLAIASDLVKWVQQRLIRDGRVKRGYLGIDSLDVNPKIVRQDDRVRGHRRFKGIQDMKDLLEELGLSEARGVIITRVEDRSPAASVPLQPLDVLTEIDGKPIRNRHQLFFQVAELEPGKRVKLKYVRDRRLLEAEVELAERRPVDPWGGPQR
ncbi:MAG: trypsin-like peptidase domain-containing protein [Planctomycetes bacterium]|nr:trypsin-like peptidase domain-containing protein [Planctomycetota bacterium]